MSRALVLVALTFALALAAAAPAQSRSAERYPAAFERAFMIGCTQSRPSLKPMCRCALSWLERRYTYGRLVAIYHGDRRRFTRIALAAVNACR